MIESSGRGTGSGSSTTGGDAMINCAWKDDDRVFASGSREATPMNGDGNSRIPLNGCHNNNSNQNNNNRTPNNGYYRRPGRARGGSNADDIPPKPPGKSKDASSRKASNSGR